MLSIRFEHLLVLTGKSKVRHDVLPNWGVTQLSNRNFLLESTHISRNPRIKFHRHYGRYVLLGSTPLVIGTQPIQLNCQPGIQKSKSQLVALFWHFKIIQISKKQNAHGRIRTHDGVTEGLDVLHYAIKSLVASLIFQVINIFSMTGNVIYFTIYDKLT